MIAVPAGWKIKALGEVARVYSGGTPSRSVSAYWGGSIPWVSTAEIDVPIITTTREKITASGLAHSAAKIAPAGTLLMAMYGQGKTRGKTSILGIPAAMNQACAAIEVGPDVDANYLLGYLSSRYREIRLLSNSGGQENLSGEIIKRIPVILPPLHEQTRIAATLQDVTELIAALERMIAKKQAIKHGMMQQLLTSNVGFRDSPEPGSEAALGAITTWMSGGTPNRNNPAYWGGTVPWISAATLRHSRVQDSDQYLTEAGVRAGSKLAPVGATLVLVRGMALHRETRIGMATRPVSFNQDVKALIPKPGILPEYLVYALQAQSTRVLDLVSSAGSGTGVLDTQLLKRLPIWVPDETMQRAIVTAIDAADRHIEALQRRIVKTQAIKHGMAQQLLTGQTRLRVKESAAE